jgi:hypothetical protein
MCIAAPAKLSTCSAGRTFDSAEMHTLTSYRVDRSNVMVPWHLPVIRSC